MSELRIGVILGSTRPGRRGATIADWVIAQAAKRTDATFELVDLADYPLPHLDEAAPARMQQYAHDHTKKWSAKIDEFDGYIFVTPEYNHSTSGVLKNAIDYLFNEWNNKAAGIVSYGVQGGTRAAEHLRLVLGELMIADVRQQVVVNLMTDFEGFTTFAPGEALETALEAQFDQVVAWGAALEGTRAAAAIAA